jgi:hypothetical protein
MRWLWPFIRARVGFASLKNIGRDFLAPAEVNFYGTSVHFNFTK